MSQLQNQKLQNQECNRGECASPLPKEELAKVSGTFNRSEIDQYHLRQEEAVQEAPKEQEPLRNEWADEDHLFEKSTDAEVDSKNKSFVPTGVNQPERQLQRQDEFLEVGSIDSATQIKNQERGRNMQEKKVSRECKDEKCVNQECKGQQCKTEKSPEKLIFPNENFVQGELPKLQGEVNKDFFDQEFKEIKEIKQDFSDKDQSELQQDSGKGNQRLLVFANDSFVSGSVGLKGSSINNNFFAQQFKEQGKEFKSDSFPQVQQQEKKLSKHSKCFEPFQKQELKQKAPRKFQKTQKTTDTPLEKENQGLVEREQSTEKGFDMKKTENQQINLGKLEAQIDKLLEKEKAYYGDRLEVSEETKPEETKPEETKPEVASETKNLNWDAYKFDESRRVENRNQNKEESNFVGEDKQAALEGV